MSVFRRKWRIQQRQRARRLVWFNPSAGASNVTITTTTGSATSSGVSAHIDEVVNSGPGSATSSGIAAHLDEVINAGPGSASSSGVATHIDETVETTTGSSTASGVQATIQESSGVTITTTTGSATASGVSSHIDETVATTTGSAASSGIQADISITQLITTVAGSATASGISAHLDETIKTTEGTAYALGIQATITDGTEEVSVTKGGAARGKRKKRRKLIDYAEQPITQIIHNLESDRKLSQGVIENTKQVIKPVEAPILEDVGPLKETLKSLLKEKQTVKTVTQQIADLTTKPVEEPVKEVVEYATKEDVQALNVKLDLILKRLDNLSNDMEIIAALAAS